MATQSPTVNLTEVVRNVSKMLAAANDSQISPSQVNSVFRCIGKFISFSFSKQADIMIADITQFGTVIRNTKLGQASEFVPSNMLQLETKIFKAIPAKLIADSSVARQELLLQKLAAVTQLSEAAVNQILNSTAKVIGHFIRTEGLSVILDFHLSSNEVLLFEKEQCNFIDKVKLRESLYQTTGTNTTRPMTFPFVKDRNQFGNNIRAKIAHRQGYLSPESIA